MTDRVLPNVQRGQMEAKYLDQTHQAGQATAGQPLKPEVSKVWFDTGATPKEFCIGGTASLHVNNGLVTPYAGDYDYFLEKTDSKENARAAITACSSADASSHPAAVSSSTAYAWSQSADISAIWRRMGAW